MMGRISITVLAFGAALALGVIGASSASALLFLTQLNQELFTVLSLNSHANPSIFETKGGTKVECETISGNGLILNKTDIALGILLTLHKCESAGTTCKSPGEPSGLVKSLELGALLVTTLAGLYGIETFAEKGNQNGNRVFVECASGLQKLAVTGTAVGEALASKAALEMGVVEVKGEFRKGANKGELAIKDYWTLAGIVEAKLTATLTGLINETAEASLEAVGDAMALHIVKVCHN